MSISRRTFVGNVITASAASAFLDTSTPEASAENTIKLPVNQRAIAGSQPRVNGPRARSFHASETGARLDCDLSRRAKSGGGIPTDNAAIFNALLQSASPSNIDPANIAALVNPAHGFSGIATVTGPGLAAYGFRSPDALVPNGLAYISAAAYPGHLCIKYNDNPGADSIDVSLAGMPFEG